MTAEQADRQERRKRRTRQAIQTAALKLFAERGYRETTINDIAERADVAPRTVTVHFPAKEELLFDAEPFTLDSLSKRLSERATARIRARSTARLDGNHHDRGRDQRVRAGRTFLGAARLASAHHQR